MQKKKTRKLWAFLLLLTMLTTLVPTTWTKAVEMPEAVINGEEHAELSLAEIFENYEHTDPTEFYAQLTELKELAAEVENTEAAKALYDKLDVAYTKAYTMWITSNVATYVDATDSRMLEENAYNTALINQMRDQFCICIRDLLELPGAGDIVAELTEDDIEFFSTYEEMTKEQLDAITREQELLQEYGAKQLEANMLTVTVNGTQMGFADIESAIMSGLLDADTYYNKHMELMDKQNSLLGDVYLRLVKVRQEIAALYDYDNYNDYMYENYGRDYTPEEIQKFSDSVKTYLSGPYYYLRNLTDFSAPCLQQTYEPEEIFDLLSTYIPQTSADLQDGLNHLIDNKLYDIAYSDVKMSGAFTTYFPYYNTECIVMQPSGNTYDMLTMVHEFGHFNADYQQGSMGSIDVAEVQSQGLEFLFMEHYEDIFGDDAGIVEEYVTLQQLYSFISGCLNNELETWAYLQKDLTLEAMNEKHAELLTAYEQMQPGTWTTEYYSKSWVQTPHYFTSPCYYISYATSVAGAFAIRELAMENPTAAVNAYLNVANAETDKGFSEVMDEAGLGDVLAPDVIKAVGEELMEHFDLEKRFEELLAQMQTPQPDTEEPQPEEPQEEEDQKVPEPQKICHVRKGDTLAKIGKRYQVDWKEIAQLNGIKAPYRIYAGQELILPDHAVINTEKVTVQKGDTLGKIAASLGLNWQVLAELLGIHAPYTIYEGQVLEFSY
ncbi:MAG: LysM peptidoglycan-binding domain-containing protein [Lachnospiraceae bacterium]|nr:LysM peptidoglycan-binding domain-containing protein [Lachnospiraceae bacterium]